METQITLQLKKAIKEVTGVDVNQVSRKREIIEARAIYYKILKQTDKKKSLQSIGDTVGKDHATVLHSLKNYDMFEQFNPTLKQFRKEILSKLNLDTFKSSIDINKDEEIYNLNLQIIKLQEQINEQQKPRNKYNIVNNIENLLLETEGTEQQQIIIERLQAVYKMNRNLKL